MHKPCESCQQLACLPRLRALGGVALAAGRGGGSGKLKWQQQARQERLLSVRDANLSGMQRSADPSWVRTGESWTESLKERARARAACSRSRGKRNLRHKRKNRSAFDNDGERGVQAQGMSRSQPGAPATATAGSPSHHTAGSWLLASYGRSGQSLFFAVRKTVLQALLQLPACISAGMLPTRAD